MLPEEFARLDIRAGTVFRCEPFPEARKPAYKLWIDFGPDIGVKASSARITDLYGPEDIVGWQVLAVVNFPPRQVGPFKSEVLTLGVYLDEEAVVLVRPERTVPNGARLG
jgi:tRNA-binding protein